VDFHFNEEQQAFAGSAQALFADFCGDEQLRLHDAGDAPFMQALWRQCLDNGLHSVLVPEAQGGMGMGMTELIAVLEQQGRALALVPLAEHQLAAATLAHFQGRTIGDAALLTLALGRPPLTARRLDGTFLLEGDLLLDGVVHAVPLAAQSSHALLEIALDGEPRLVLLDLATPGLRLTAGRSQHHLAVADLHCAALTVPAACLLPAGALEWLEPRLVAALAALQVGVSQQQLQRTVDYLGERKQFGRAVGSFQLVAGQMADAHIALEALRSALAQLAYRLDAGLGCLPQALSVRVLAAEAAHLAGHKTQHVHGGLGVDLSYPIHRFLYWSRALANALGGAEQSLARLGNWLADNDNLGWKYDLPEDTGAQHAI
jgi:alkylation response protein AidB-like acyl-CoA dehydrogenase